MFKPANMGSAAGRCLYEAKVTRARWELRCSPERWTGERRSCADVSARFLLQQNVTVPPQGPGVRTTSQMAAVLRHFETSHTSWMTSVCHLQEPRGCPKTEKGTKVTVQNLFEAFLCYLRLLDTIRRLKRHFGDSKSKNFFLFSSSGGPKVRCSDIPDISIKTAERASSF